MEFLRQNRPKIIRTTMYGDQEFSHFELELLHTPLLQRLYDLRQLGFSDRVYPDAIHSRFNHVLGATEMASRMADRLAIWLSQNKDLKFAYAIPEAGGKLVSSEISAEGLGVLLQKRKRTVRLIALLHDVTHGAFGHTLEDEVSVFDEKHDDPPRQIRFFDALIAQLVYLWNTELRLRDSDADIANQLVSLDFKPDDVLAWAAEIGSKLDGPSKSKLAESLRDVELAMRFLIHLGFAHQNEARELPTEPKLLIDDVAAAIHGELERSEFVLHRDLFLIDMVGNTICADLLDYARRDAQNAGLKVQFDERLIRYLCVVSVTGDLSPTHQSCIRLAIQFFTDKMRHDVLSEMSAVLKARYVISERVLFHPTKCAAGAMLGTAVQLLGVAHLPSWMQALGDQQFLKQLADIAELLQDFCAAARKKGQSSSAKGPSSSVKVDCEAIIVGLSAQSRIRDLLGESVRSIIGLADGLCTPEAITKIETRVRGARLLLWRLSARRFSKLTYRMRAGAQHSGGEGDERIAAKYVIPSERFRLEREIERLCGLPIGSIVVHCPRRKTSMKVAEVLVVGDDLTRVAKLRNVIEVTPEALVPYQEEILAIEKMYLSIWQFHIYVDSAYFDKHPIIGWAANELLRFPNDKLLERELMRSKPTAYGILAGDLRGEIPFNHLPEVIARVDNEAVRMRFDHSASELKARLLTLIKEVISGKAEPGEQLPLPS
ncbi:MAG: HD domain-containing protein [Terriglobales bacterium]